ncbi:MAG TPA: Os1348 family NHLP clan protein [Candidatus Limnocylindria bacterium]|jgi:hypothetical protein|nr:Os1348 family NHLP clan protein [Candidatus Limnocylindria bacterium]
MSTEALNAVLDRAMNDATFRAKLAADPASALAGYDLTDDERSRFTAGTAQAERLEERMSKTDLSAAFGAKTSTPNLRTPTKTRRR